MQSFISDLALILVLAGIVTLLFKRLRQPLVLGYIVAGFLTGPHMPLTPTVTTMESVQTWADLGVIFIMFTLGLEFSFKKIFKMGLGPVVTACCILFFMISLGTLTGRLFGWGHMDSLFLGGMLAMSSTTIIYKAFDDLGIRQQKFTGEVLSVLILEDILGILLMVVLSALAASRQFEGMQLAGSMLKLVFFLILWFVVGSYIVPLFLQRTRRWANRETLLIVSIGLCFLMVVCAERVGYSSALGAFMMGSILAETAEAETIERIVSPVKDLFGAIFFVSVGMLVDPVVLANYWQPILAICATIVVGQAVFGTTSFMLGGQPLRTAMQCGFSMAQIGEFAFILATLGMSLHVTSNFLYPVVVSVSIITTFSTPYMIRAANPVCDRIERIIPSPMLLRLHNRKSAPQQAEKQHGAWHRLLVSLLAQVGVYLTLSVAVIAFSFSVLLPLCRGLLGHWPGNATCGILTLCAAAPFLRAIVMRKNHSEEWKAIRLRGRSQRVLLGLTLAVRYAIATAASFYVLEFLSPFRWYWHVGAAAVLVGLMVASRRVKWLSIRMERTFLQNLRSRDVMARSRDGHLPGYAGRLESRDLHIAELELPEDSAWAGRTLADLSFGHDDGILIAAIVRGTNRINIPDGHTRLFPSDRIEAIGDDRSLAEFARRMRTELCPAASSYKGRLTLRKGVVREKSPFVGLTIGQSEIRSRYHCMAVGFEDGEGRIEPAAASRLIQRNDIIWAVGEDDQLRKLMQLLEQA